MMVGRLGIPRRKHAVDIRLFFPAGARQIETDEESSFCERGAVQGCAYPRGEGGGVWRTGPPLVQGQTTNPPKPKKTFIWGKIKV